VAKTRQIVHPTDFSRGAHAAFVQALRMAKHDHATLTLVHVVEPVPALSDEGYATHWMAMQNRVRTAAGNAFARLVARARKAGVRARPLLIEGWTAEEILKAARKQHARLIVMGTHGRSGIRRLLVGSVAARVVALSPCPVMTVHVK
jgi:nucleotide-binding universal stress UspA family protein